MKTRPFGSRGVPVPVIGQGTWNMERNARASVAALRAGLDAGMTHIDTAEMYGSGRVEEIVAQAIAGRRHEVFLVSKVLPGNASYGGVLRACEASLGRLGTDHLDLFLLHWPGSHAIEETISAFEALERDGKIRAWGLSNFDIDDLERALAVAGEGRIACNQVYYHLQERAIEHAVVPWCAQHGITVVGYSPFGSGRFPGVDTPGGRVLAEIGKGRGVGAREVALAFLVRQDGTFAIPKAATVAHVADNARAGDLELRDDEIRRIDAAFPRGRRRRLATI